MIRNAGGNQIKNNPDMFEIEQEKMSENTNNLNNQFIQQIQIKNSERFIKIPQGEGINSYLKKKQQLLRKSNSIEMESVRGLRKPTIKQPNKLLESQNS